MARRRVYYAVKSSQPEGDWRCFCEIGDFSDVLDLFSPCDVSASGVSTKRPDVICRPPSDLEALTLAEMLVKGWRLRGACTDTRRCKLIVKVNLSTLIRVYGPHQPWWGKRTPCPREDCQGEIRYMAQSIQGGSWVSIDQQPSDPAVFRWRTAMQRAGWRGER